MAVVFKKIITELNILLFIWLLPYYLNNRIFLGCIKRLRLKKCWHAQWHICYSLVILPRAGANPETLQLSVKQVNVRTATNETGSICDPPDKRERDDCNAVRTLCGTRQNYICDQFLSCHVGWHMEFQCTPLSLAEGVFTWVTQGHSQPISKGRGRSMLVVRLRRLWRDAAGEECVCVLYLTQELQSPKGPGFVWISQRARLF